MVTRFRKLALALLAVSLLVGIRLIHLGADTPLDVGTWSRGLYVDEGYKVLSPRNLVLFGSTHWNPHDTYPGWMKASPATQWPYYLAFRAFGPELAGARLVTILYFVLLLIGYCYATVDAYDWKLFLGGLILLGLQETVFFFSRVALFEIPVAAVVYVLLFILRKRCSESLGLTLPLVAVFAAAATFGVKVSALIYLLPVVVGLAIAGLYRAAGKRLKTGLTLLVLLALFAVSVYYLSRRYLWLSLLSLPPETYFRRVLLNELMPSSALLVAAGLVCAFDALLTQRRRFLSDPYRSAVLLMVLLGPLTLAALSKQPLRYYVPLLPAYTLLVLEWLHLFPCRKEGSVHAPWLRAAVCFAVLCWALFSLAQAFNREVLFRLPVNLGQSPGLTDSAMYSYAAPLAVVVGAVAWKVRARLLRGRTLLWVVAAMIGLSGLRDVIADGRFLLNPSYRSAEISKAIENLVPPEASILGDYAPFFAAHTRLRAIYMNRSYNYPSQLPLLRADYFLFSNTTEMRDMPRLIQETEGVKLMPPVYSSRYAERDVVLYPLCYTDAGESGS